jgi:hypothetical protein
LTKRPPPSANPGYAYEESSLQWHKYRTVHQVTLALAPNSSIRILNKPIHLIGQIVVTWPLHAVSE